MFSTAGESDYLLEPIRESGDFILYRGKERGEQMRVLAVAVAAEQPPPQILGRLEHEFSLASELDVSWAARPLALTRHQGRAALILMDPGGDPLDQEIEQQKGHSIDLARFLVIAIGLAAALGQAHRRGLIHKDIKPANSLVNDTGHVWLTGFGIASRLPRERPSPAPPEIIAGTLAYMSPEQTGRMNRSIDTRSDLYSLGVTLYQLLTGMLPFTAAGPLEWVHCHIARQPLAPADRAAVPAPLSAIIMRLLAKNAEERYQTAAGLEADLRRCLTEWQTHGRITPFPLATNDASDRLLIPEKLYGRAHEVETLLAAFARVVAQGRAELVLVSGYSGVGKSSVVNELHKVLAPSRGLFAAGKFDQYKRDVPYATLAQAMQALVREILVKSEAELAQWRQALREALEPNGQLMVELIPELEFVIGPQPAVAELPPQEARGRFQLVFRRFLAAFARPEHPLALFLDDLQWLDTATLELLEHLITDPEVRHVLLIGAYRDNEVSAAHPLLRTFSAIRDAGAKTQEIVLSPLGLDDIGHLTADSLGHTHAATAPLAELIYQKTGGNPFFAIQFFTALAEEGMLQFDRDAPGWIWDLERIRAKGYSDNVVDLMLGKLQRLSGTTQAALQQLACLGNLAEITTLSMVFGLSEESIHAGFFDAARDGLIFRKDGYYGFPHDRIQEAAYTLIPVDARAKGHLEIARLFLKHLPADKHEERIFDIVNQFNRGAELITSEDERYQLAELNLVAGKRAKTSTAFASALRYFIAGDSILSDAPWEHRPDLIFQLKVQRAECEFLTGEPVSAADRLEMLRSRATNTVELAMATCLGIDVYMTLGQFDRAVTICLDYLRHVGIDWPLHPTEEQVRSEYDQIWSKLGGRAIEEVIDFPVMTDPTSIATLGVLSKAGPPTSVVNPNLAAMLNFRAVSLSVEYGNNDGSCLNYVWMGMLAGPRFGDYKDAFRFGQLGYELVEKCGSKSTDAGTYNLFATTIMPWTKHISECCEVMRQSIEVANGMGDLIFAAYSRLSLNTLLFAAGIPLVEVQSEAQYGLDLVRKSKFDLVIDAINPQLGLIRTLRGSTAAFGSLDHAEFDELQFERHLASNPAMAQTGVWYWIRKLQARFFAGDFASAIEASLRARPLLSTSPFFELAEYEFYGALARAACCISTTPGQNLEHYDVLKAHHRQLEMRAERCPENLEDRAALAGAELARVEGRTLDAERLYERSIRSAREHGFIQNEGLAHELAAQHYLARGIEIAGFAYLRNARNCYDRWGAHGKVKQLEERYPHLREDRSSALSPAPAPPAGLLDVEAVVKASQALSSEMVLPNLIERLMAIALQNAGAERGLLILLRDGEPRIEAQASTQAEKIEVAVRDALVMESDLPQSALHYVLRTQQAVLLDDAASDPLYANDTYVRQKRARSVLCLPIIKQARLIGALYLENNLAPSLFTPDRLVILRLLASQAAISLENAALYTDLQLQVGLLQRLPVSAWTLKPDGTPDFVNEVWLEFSGQSLDFVRSHPEAWMTAVHPEDREIAEKSFWEGVRSGQGFAMETRNRRAQDQTYRWQLQQAVVLRDAQGKVLRFVGTTTDIDDQKRIEEILRQAQADLARINRVTTMGELTASLAHELRQPISGVILNANVSLRWLERDLPDLDEVRNAASKIVRDAQRAAEMISRIRVQFEKGSAQREPIDINEIKRETIALLRDEAIRYKISLRTEFAADLPRIVGDRVQLQQVVMNLIVNAIEAMKDVDGARELIVRSERTENQQILVSVGDTGKGFSPELAEQIFDPFFTTKSNGTGMGLRISRSIIESHGGRLWATAGTRRGATFQFTLPAAADRGAGRSEPIL